MAKKKHTPLKMRNLHVDASSNVPSSFRLCPEGKKGNRGGRGRKKTAMKLEEVASTVAGAGGWMPQGESGEGG